MVEKTIIPIKLEEEDGRQIVVLSKIKKRSTGVKQAKLVNVPLGGAMHGARELSITKDRFVEIVGNDLQYFTTQYFRQ